MATQVQFRRGTTTQNNAFTGAVAEITYDTEVKTLRLHDGTTAGGGAVVATLGATQTFVNKTLSTGSAWQGNAVALGYGGTGSSLTAVQGAVVYSGSSGMAMGAAGTSGQVLTSGGTSAPVWVNSSALTVGTATSATTASNILGGSAGYLMYQIDTNQTGFISPGANGYVLKSTGASTAPSWASPDITVGTTTISIGGSSTSVAGLTAIDATSGATSFFATPTSPALFAAGTAVTIGAATGTLTVNNASLVHNSTAGTKVAVGTTAQRPTGATGIIRYNTDLASFEGYAASAWASLGGVKSVDGYTFIRAETSAGASNGELEFYVEAANGTSSTKAGGWTKDALTVANNLIVTGNVTVNGTTTTTNSTTVTVDDPVITLGGDAAPASDDNKDRGVEFNYHNGTLPKVGFFGFDDSTGEFTFIPDATNTSEVFSGTAGAARFGNTNVATLDTSGIVNINDTTQSTVYTNGALVVDGGAGIAKDLRVHGTIYAGGDGVIAGNIAITGNLTVNGTTTTTSTANSGYGAALIQLNYNETGLLTDNGKDIGIEFDYYKTSAKKGFLVWKNSNSVLTYYSDASVTAEVVSGTVGDAKFGGLELVGDLAVNGGDITTSSTGTATVFNSNATTLNMGAAATTVNIGAATGTLTLNNASTVTAGDLSVNGGDLLTNQTTATLFNTTATTLSIGGAATTLDLGAATGTLTINNASLVHNSTGATKIAAGTSAQRPGTPAVGQIRYNSDISSFEGYASGSWASLGGVKSVDGLTYILAESSAGASNDELEFYTATDASTTAKRGGWNATRLLVSNTTASTTASTGALVVTGGVGIGGALFTTGNITSAADIISNSDRRMKSDIQPITSALEKVQAITGVTFIKTGVEKRTAGVIAQDVLAVHPEVVHENEDGMLSVSYGNMVGLLIEAIKEQQQQINELKAKLGN